MVVVRTLRSEAGKGRKILRTGLRGRQIQQGRNTYPDVTQKKKKERKRKKRAEKKKKQAQRTYEGTSV
jgi:hypothetical protein